MLSFYLEGYKNIKLKENSFPEIHEGDSVSGSIGAGGLVEEDIPPVIVIVIVIAQTEFSLGPSH